MTKEISALLWEVQQITGRHANGNKAPFDIDRLLLITRAALGEVKAVRDLERLRSISNLESEYDDTAANIVCEAIEARKHLDSIVKKDIK